MSLSHINVSLSLPTPCLSLPNSLSLSLSSMNISSGEDFKKDVSLKGKCQAELFLIIKDSYSLSVGVLSHKVCTDVQMLSGPHRAALMELGLGNQRK